MNWDAIGAIGEIVGAFAVVLSLVYLAVQVRQNTTALRGATAAEAVGAIREWNGRLIDDPVVSELFTKGVEDPTQLSDAERRRFVPIAFNFFKTVEHLHYQYARGILDPEIWTGWEVVLTGYAAGAGMKAYYHERRAAFSREFQQWVETSSPHPGFKRIQGLADALSSASTE